jgi:beta-galactosidase GanA
VGARDGEFQFASMQRILDQMQHAGIKVILGTPTYSVPTWRYQKHPEILVTHGDENAPPLGDPYHSARKECPTVKGSG